MIYGDGIYAEVLRHYIGNQHDHAWIAHDMPLDEHGAPQTPHTLRQIAAVLDTLPTGQVVIISTPLPVGTCAALEEQWPKLHFAVQTENVRVATAYDDFKNQSRIVIGTRWTFLHSYFTQLLHDYTDRFLFVTPESAEMTKHALNGYLALTITYGNTIGRLCELWGADPTEVIRAVRSDPRVSSTSPLVPGPNPSPHLMREIHTLVELGAGPLLEGLKL